MERVQSTCVTAEAAKDKLNPFTEKPYSDRYWQMLEERQRLPVWELKEDFMKALDNGRCIVVAAEPGSGKTTQVPQWCMEYLLQKGVAGQRGLVACAQPRRAAAIAAASRVADEMDLELGQQVGYSIRFEDCVSAQTALIYCTEGALLREMMKCPSLSDYGIVVIDEAQERTMSSDILMALLKRVIKQHAHVKLVVLCATTVDTGRLQSYFENYPVLTVPGRTHPVEVIYASEPKESYFEAAVETVVRVHASEETEGDILLFLTCQEEIEEACRRIEREMKKLGSSVGALVCVPLYSTLPPDQQQRIYESSPPSRPGAIGRKCVVSTSLAEASLPIRGVKFVIDSGFSKQRVYSPSNRLESLLLGLISKATAKQRAFCAGHTQPGKCFRLYTEKTYREEMQDQTLPEIMRSNLCSAMLLLKKLGVEDLTRFDFLDAPAPEALESALELLNNLGAINDAGGLTALGSLMTDFPLDPQLAKALVASTELKCSDEMLSIAAMLSVPPCFLQPKEMKGEADEAKARFVHVDGDHLTLLNVFQAFKQHDEDVQWCNVNFVDYRALKMADFIRTKLEETMDKLELRRLSTPSDSKAYSINIRKALAAGFFMQVAHLQPSGHYVTIEAGQPVNFHPTTGLDRKPEWVLFHRLELTTKSDYTIKMVTEVQPEWLLTAAPQYFGRTASLDGDIRQELQRVQKPSIAK